jgi:hypothetical protein
MNAAQLPEYTSLSFGFVYIAGNCKMFTINTDAAYFSAKSNAKRSALNEFSEPSTATKTFLIKFKPHLQIMFCFTS